MGQTCMGFIFTFSVEMDFQKLRLTVSRCSVECWENVVVGVILPWMIKHTVTQKALNHVMQDSKKSWDTLRMKP